ncbi:Vacuolar protein sorting-associated protein 16 [Sorochytrium milnesiophthora]
MPALASSSAAPSQAQRDAQADAASNHARLAGQHFARHRAYELTWPLASQPDNNNNATTADFSALLLAQAPLGGPIALFRDAVFIGSRPSSAALQLYTPSGQLISQHEWTADTVVGLGWTMDERVVVVMDTGSVRLYPLLDEYKQFTLGKDAAEYGVLDCRFCPTAVAAMTGNYQFIVVSNWHEPRPRNLAHSGLESLPHAWTIVSPLYSLSRQVEVLATFKTSLVVIDHREAQNQLLTQGPFSHVASSPNGRHIALLARSSCTVWIFSADMTQNIAELNITPLCSTHGDPTQLLWCTQDVVAVAFTKAVLLANLQGNHHIFNFDESVLVSSDHDALRVLSPSSFNLIWKVSPVVLNRASFVATLDAVYDVASHHPAKALLEASELFEQKSPQAEERLRDMRDANDNFNFELLTRAYDTCLQAAGQEWDPAKQRSLLKAASFARCFLDLTHYDPDVFVALCKTIRTLNAVRDYKVAIPLTHDQYTRLTPEVLVNRLANRRLHLMAVRVAAYLELDDTSVLMHWAQTKVAAPTLPHVPSFWLTPPNQIQHASIVDDDDLTAMLLDKLNLSERVSFAHIAKAAYASGRSRLATNLLEHESEPGQQVPLLLSMQEGELALIKAIQSYDADLVYLVLMHLKQSLSLGDFLRTITKKPLGVTLMEKYALEHGDLQLLRDFYYQDDRRLQLGDLLVMESKQAEEVEQRVAKLRESSRVFQEDKNCALEAKCVDTQMRLLQVQSQYERELNESPGTYTNLSLHQTLHRLTIKSQHARATKLKNDFKISDKTFWWIKLRALAHTRDWAEMDKLAKVKKSPIGYQPFVEECITAGAQEEAKKYIGKCDVKARFEQYMRINAFVEAGTVAHQLKDLPKVLEAREKVHNDPATARALDGLIAQLRGNR